ncbi:MAG: hypothetical protein ACLQOO_23940 [Terriglobia bacterium]
MTVNERLTRLEAAVTSFVKSSTEFQVEIRRMVRHHEATPHNHNAMLKDHTERIERLDAMIIRFDEWLRGQGPTDGHQKRKK